MIFLSIVSSLFIIGSTLIGYSQDNIALGTGIGTVISGVFCLLFWPMYKDLFGAD